MQTQSGYDVDYQVRLALGLVHRATVDAVELACVFSIPSADDIGTRSNAARITVSTRDLQGLTLVNKQSVVTNIQAPEADPLTAYLVLDMERGSAGKTVVTLERQQ